MRFLGIDIGTRFLGFAAVDKDGQPQGTGTTKFEGKTRFRLKAIAKWADDFFRHCGHEVIVGIESPWVGANAQAAILLAKAWGIVAGVAWANGCNEIYSISPKTAKKALAGSGNATKYEMSMRAEMLCGRTVTSDEADAIGVALATLGEWNRRGHGKAV